MGRKQIVQSLLKMRNLAVPEPGIYGIAPLDDAKMPGNLSNILRVFSPIKPSKGRKPNAEYGFDFDKYTDVLSDSPITIAAKLGTNWEDYNQHVVVQLGVCNFRCWYCYVDYKFLSGGEVTRATAGEILDQFLQKREQFKFQGKHLNVLRISGGEPMLAPDLILSCLRMVKQLGLEEEICIKTETNLSPLMKNNSHSVAEEWADFDELAQYSNFLIHPTLHGISANSLRDNSAVDSEMFEIVCQGLQTLIEHQLDFFPSFGANTVPVEDVKPFFERMKKMNKNLPLRFAVRSFTFDYAGVTERKHGKRPIQVFDHSGVIQTWDALLQDEYGLAYAEIPRHRVPLYRQLHY